jgi:hypothetical protein
MGLVRQGSPEASLEAPRRHEPGTPPDCALLYHRRPHLLLQEELVRSATFRYITDVITPDEALAILKAKEATKKEREATVRLQG